jgi:hypothetical protein
VHKTKRQFAALPRLFALAAASVAAFSSSGLRADPFPAGGQGQNVEQVGFSGLDGRYGGFKIAIKHTANDKWYL